ncbi:cytochrome C1 family-domain-containing protein [Pavlovales sp. CCMP2436]|nr:cytochrome C1 family-domain-containing protein [Pavlovales sp. CCMP2436]
MPVSNFARLLASRGAQAVGATVAAGTFAASGVAYANDNVLHAPAYPWSFNGFFNAYDAASIRRGHQVYTQICATCHSLNRIAFRNLVDVCYTEDEAKALAMDVRLLPRPSFFFFFMYACCRQPFFNNRAYPPDLSLIVKARHGGPDYIFALLTGYKTPPAGVGARETQWYNPYFAGGWIGMPPPLDEDGAVDYFDGTPSTITQMAKDVSYFLQWASEPEHDDRKLMGFKWIVAMTIALGFTTYYKRFKWSALKTRRLEFEN